MARNIQLLLIENVENLGIVGDVVKVRPGYARNYLLPHGLAEHPSDDRLAELQERRRQVQQELSELRRAREELHARMEAVSVTLKRSSNDQGLLYGSVLQRDIADALSEAGYDVGVNSVRLGQPIKRVGEYQVPIQFEKDLRTEINLVIESDQPPGEERVEMEFDNEGNLIRPRSQRKRRDRRPDAASGEPAQPAAEQAVADER